MRYKVYPLSGTFMITAILGFFISALYIWDLSEAWGFTFSLFFVLMFVAAMISLTKTAIPEHISIKPEIYITGKKKKNKKRVKKKKRKKR